MRPKLPVSAGALRKLLREIESSRGGEHVLAVGGASELAPVLRQQFLRGRADPGAVLLGGPEGADAYVHVLAGAPADEDVEALRRARKARVPAIAVLVGVSEADGAIPYVLATDVVPVAGGGDFRLDAIARAIAARLDEDGAPLAARVPLLREPVCERLVSAFARKNGLVAAAVWIPGADLPVLALNELRLVLRLAQVYGVDDVRERLPELAATLGAGFGLRALARELLDLVPGAGWALKGAVAYGGTRALGEAACRRFAAAATQPRGAGVPVVP
ncbi:MAG TPA: hypothetical protein VJ814_05645 [Gaiellaceae bacterium]|nr:hypothetical protein [Gaiellaceae bacterium]